MPYAVPRFLHILVCGEADGDNHIRVSSFMSIIRIHASCAIAPALALAVFSVDVFAQVATDSPLSPVVVTASRTEQLQKDALPHITVLGAEDIRRSQAVDLPSLLKRETGIQFTQNGGYGQASGLFVRGAETRQTLILLDGVPLTKQDTTGTVSIEHLMLDQIDRIEIVRGNVSSIYGSGAIGGVIQIFTKRGDGPPQATVNAEVGSRQTSRLSAGVSGSSGGTHYVLSASNFRTDGFSAIDTSRYSSASPDKDGYRNTSVSGMLSQEFAKGHEVGMRFSKTEGKFDFDSIFGAPTDVHTAKTDVDAITVFSKNKISDNWLSRLSYSEARDRNANHYESTFGLIEDQYRTRTRTLQWNNDITLSRGLILTAGVERQWQSLSSNDGYGDVFDVKRNASSVYAGLQGQFGAHQLQVNVRHDELENVDSATTGYLGYGYLINDVLKATASVSSGFSAPPLGYLYAPFFGNPNLKPERARSAEAGLQYAQQGTLMRAVVFVNRTSEQLQYDLVTSRFENVAKASNRGLELSASGKWRDIDLRASFTLQDPRDDTTDQRLRRRARTLGSLAAYKSFGPWELGGDLGYTGERPDGDQQLGAYWLANLNGRYRISKQLALYGRIENVFDRNYQTAYGYNQPPRGFFVGINWQP
jgi:vitamin B12 transporter